MKHSYLRRYMFVVMILCGLLNLSAQITLHEAANVTQTKATLSADFPDLYSEHGFQYKYGTLPEIDEFSKVALAPISDPVQLATSANAWSARTIKGWVESNSNLSVGQSSVMSAKVKFSETTTVTFEWSVDSEEGIGILSFIVDGKTVREISGEVDFTQISYQTSAGEHILQWQYKKTAATNVGLDLGMVRNINLQNTTEGEWLTKISSTSEFQLSNLYPGQDYIYRAFSNDINIRYSKIGGFKSTEVIVDNPTIVNIRQASASLNCNSTYGDAIVETGFICSSIQPESDFSPFAQALLSDDTYGRSITITKTSHWKVGNNYVYHNSYNVNPEIYVYINLLEDTEISFEWRTGGASDDCLFYVDGVKKGSVWGSTYKTQKCKIPAGSHTLKWRAAYVNTYNNAYTCIRNLSIPGLSYSDILGSTSITDAKISRPNDIFIGTQSEFFSSSLSGLTPNKKYYVQSFVIPNYSSELSASWIETKSQVVTFVTENVHPQIFSATNITQATAIINGEISFGDAIVKSAGLQYKDATGTRWTDYPKDTTGPKMSQNITRLKPNSTYHYRSYIQAQDCDTVFSEIGEFTTLAVEALKPIVKRVSQHGAELQGIVRFGDASIYQRGMQFRKSGKIDWEEVEDNGNDSIYTLVKRNLEMSTTYEARTYVQPAGCDVIYSDILTFTTTHYVSDVSNQDIQTTQATAAITFRLCDSDENIEEAGVYYGTQYNNKDQWQPIAGAIEGNVVKVVISNLKYWTSYYYRPYVRVDGKYYFYDDLEDKAYFRTKEIKAKMTFPVISQTSVQIKSDIDAGDAIATGWGYCFGDSYDSNNFYPYEELTEIKNLSINKTYYIGLFCAVDGEYRMIAFENFTTKDIEIFASFTNITQTRATMKVSVYSGETEVTDLKYRMNYGEYIDCGETVNFSGLTPGSSYTIQFNGKVNGEDRYWTTEPNTSYEYRFITKEVNSSISISDISQTSAKIKGSSNYGDATYLSSGLEVGNLVFNSENDNFEKIITELLPGQTYSCRSFVETAEGGRVYSSSRTFTTKNIECETLPVSNISNRSATMNGTIECDSYSSAEFGFQWKQMEGWASEPAFTKGRKLDDGTISASLVNGMLEPNTDYQYRTAIRYQDKIYCASNWVTFRTESEFIYYPASVYTIFRTDRENNALVLCGYYVAGSELIVNQGYEYWQTGNAAARAKAPKSPIIINTDESMQHVFAPGELPNGNYNVRAFVKTESGEIIYGATLGFTSSANGYSGVECIESGSPYIIAERGVVKVYNANQLDCVIYSISGQVLANRKISDSYDEFRLSSGNIIIVSLSNGLRKKIKI